jgi:hypothetical protein
VPVGYSKADAASVQMSINVVQKEGIFANNQTPIYLYDTQLNTYHNFVNGAYSFTASAQVDNSRFKIVYQNGMLENPNFDEHQTIAALNENVLLITSKETIEEINVYDMMGRMVMQVTPEFLNPTFRANFIQAVGVYVLKVKLSNGQVVTSKLFNKS